jgi:hypothetical protein
MRISGAAGDDGNIVVGWLVKVVVVFSVLGVLAFDGVSIGTAELAVTDSAHAAARAASQELVAGGSPQQAYQAAYAAAVQDDEINELPADEFLVGPDRAVTLTVARTTPTLVLHHIPGSEEWLVAEATATYEVG